MCVTEPEYIICIIYVCIPDICYLFIPTKLLDSKVDKNIEKHLKIPLSIWKKLHLTEFYHTDTVCGVCDKYHLRITYSANPDSDSDLHSRKVSEKFNIWKYALKFEI